MEEFGIVSDYHYIFLSSMIAQWVKPGLNITTIEIGVYDYMWRWNVESIANMGCCLVSSGRGACDDKIGLYFLFQ